MTTLVLTIELYPMRMITATYEIPLGTSYTFGDLLYDVSEQVNSTTGKRIELETILFYDATYHRIDFGHDDEEVDVSHHHTIHAVIINENLTCVAFNVDYEEVSAQWPWVWTPEAEAWLEEDLARSLARREEEEEEDRL